MFWLYFRVLNMDILVRWAVLLYFLHSSGGSSPVWEPSDSPRTFIATEGKRAEILWTVKNGSFTSISVQHRATSQSNYDNVMYLQKGSNSATFLPAFNSRKAQLILNGKFSTNAVVINFTIIDVNFELDDKTNSEYQITVLTTFLSYATGLLLEVQVPPTITMHVCQDCVNGGVIENQTITLFCNATGNPRPNIRWTKNGNHYNVSSPGNKLVFEQVTRNDKGNYTCIADNGVGNRVEENFSLFVKYKPDTPSLSPRQSDACENDSINFSCMAIAHPPANNYSLYNGNNYIGSSSSGQFSITATPPRKKTLCCVVSNEIGNSQCGYADVFVLGVITPLCKINNETTSVATAIEGNEVVLQCDISGNESYYSYQWLEVKNSMSRNISSDIQLRFDSINRTNEAQYQVTIKDKPNCFASQRRSFHITVNYKPENTIMRLSSDKNVFCEGNSMQVNCTADGKPDPVYSLYRNDEYQHGNENGVFLVTFAVNGRYEYTCEPNNTAGVGPTKSQNVTVKGPLNSEMCTINKKNNSHIQVSEMSLVDLRLVSSELERLDFTWKNGTAIMGGKLSQNITIGSITRHEGGTYQVVARDRFNCSANVECNFTVDVHYFDKRKVCGNISHEWVSENKVEAVTENTTKFSNPDFNVTCPMDQNVNVTLSHSSYEIKVTTSLPENKKKIKFSCLFKNTVGYCYRNFTIWEKVDPPIMFPCTVQLLMTYSPDLQDKDSGAYKNLKQRVEETIMNEYEKAGKKFLQKVIVNNAQEGSVWVNFALYLTANVSNPLRPLQDALDQNKGNINGLVFNENSLGQGSYVPKTTSSPTAATTTTNSTPTPGTEDVTVIIIIVVIVVVVIIAIIVMVFCYCKRHDKKRPLAEEGCADNLPMNVTESGTNNQGFSQSPQHIEPASGSCNSVKRRPKDVKDQNDNQPQSGGEQGNPTYATVDKSQNPKNKTPGEPVYADLGDFVKNGDKATGGHGGIVLPKDKVVTMPEKYEETVYATIVGTKKPTGENQNPAGGADDAPLEAAAVKATEAAEGAQKSGQAANPPKNEQKPSNDQQRQPLAKEDSATALNPNHPADSIAKLNGRNETTLTTVSN